MKELRIILYGIVFILFFIIAACRVVTADVVSIAIEELGNGEIGGNNKGEYVKLYNDGYEGSWCAGFVSYVCDKAGVTSIEHCLSAKKIYNEAKVNRLVVDKPEPGYLVCFWRDSKTSWKGHIGVVEKIDNEFIYTIEGNRGCYPSVVKRCKYAKNAVPKLLGYIKL